MQREWVLAYLADPKRNATEAARKANYANPEQSGWENRHNPNVRQYIQEHFLDKVITAEEVQARLSELAQVGYAPYLQFNPSAGDLSVDLESLLEDGKGHLVKGISYTRTGTDTAVQVVEFFDAYKALVDIGRVHGIFTDRTDVTSGGEKLEAPIYITENRGNDND